jgi:hypothetical protein
VVELVDTLRLTVGAVSHIKCWMPNCKYTVEKQLAAEKK